MSGTVSPRGQSETYVQAVVDGISDVTGAFKALPGHDRQYVARSEYLFKLLQPRLDDALFLGSDYESAFDRFEILLALEYANQEGRSGDDVYGPAGRFAYKLRGMASTNPYAEMKAEAEAAGSSWPPLVAGMFGGSSERFYELWKGFATRIGQYGWH
jgi:hypothetical protein